jgi:hypothetical protein
MRSLIETFPVDILIVVAVCIVTVILDEAGVREELQD